jgi:hypothetical protein
MDQSTELKALMLRIYDAVSRGDGDFLEGVVSSADGMVFIGTDPTEWFEDSGSVVRMLRAQAEAGVTVVPGALHAYEEGTVGWIADAGSFKLPDGSEAPFRITAVFHREGDAWKLVQEHASIGVANEEAIGQELAV